MNDNNCNSEDNAIGAKLGPYEIREEVGRGSMAAVYRAYQASVDREVAVKVILNSVARDRGAIQRFQREARLVARLEHPHILPIYDFDGGHEPPYIVMRFIDGGSLKEVMSQGKLSLDQVGYLIWQVGSALDYAHRQGIVHRDLKPSNIMIDHEGNAFITDFGIARITQGEATHLTLSGVIVGTPAYMSPEQATGESDVDARADIYALGVILFEMLTGELPFTADTAQGVIVKHIIEPAPRPSEKRNDLPPEIDQVMARTLAKDRNQRYATMDEFMEAVSSALQAPTSVSSQLPEEVEESLVQSAARPADKKTSSQITHTEQHKSVTVLYANAAEYAEIVAEERGAETARKALETLWNECERIAREKNGCVFERTDREMMALWGAISSRENDAENAVRAALGIHDILKKLGVLTLKDGEPLPIKIGIHSGLALIAPDKSGTASASGTTISIANRLMQQSDGEILITHETYKTVRGVFDMLESVPLKLRSREPLATYKVERAKARSLRTSTRGVEGVETKMVGRLSEFQVLQNALLDALEENETHAVTIVSQAGLGKSRLLYELDNFVELRPETFRILRGQATPEMTARPYALLRDIVSFRFEILDNDPPVVIRKKLENGLREMIGDEQEMAHMLGHLSGFDLSDSPYIRGLLGDPQQLAHRARQLFVRWIVKLCGRETVVMEIEDLHYADNASLDLLSTLVTENEALPLLAVFTARPSFFEKRPSWGSGQSSHQRIDLRPLDKRDSRALAQEILRNVPDLPKALRDLLVERAEGNPYYMEELVKMLLDNRVIVKESRDVWRVEESRIGHLDLPSTLVGLLQTRLDSLLYPERLTLQRAAAIGAVFYDAALLALDDADETHVEDLDGVLRHLAERGFIQLHESSAFEGSLEYALNGNILRDTLLATLVSRQVAVYHTAAARWLIAVSGKRAGEYNTLIAEHFERAGDVENAVDYLRRAGERALNLSAAAEARADFEHALRLLPVEHVSILPVSIQLGIACYYLSDHPAARQTLETALATARSQNRPQESAQASYWLSQIAALIDGNYVEAQKLLEESLALVRIHQPDSSLEARILYGLGDLNWRLSDYEAGRAFCEQSLALARRLGDVNTELFAMNRIGTILIIREANKDASRQLLQQMYEKAIKIGNRERAAVALNNLGEITYRQDDFRKARSYLDSLLALVREIEYAELEAFALANLASVSERLGNDADFRKYFTEGSILARRIGVIPTLLYLVAGAGYSRLSKNKLEARGWALVGLAACHPAADDNIHIEIRDHCIRFNLDPLDPQILALMEAGKSLDLNQTIDELIKEFGEG